MNPAGDYGNGCFPWEEVYSLWRAIAPHLLNGLVELSLSPTKPHSFCLFISQRAEVQIHTLCSASELRGCADERVCGRQAMITANLWYLLVLISFHHFASTLLLHGKARRLKRPLGHRDKGSGDCRHSYLIRGLNYLTAHATPPAPFFAALAPTFCVVLAHWNMFNDEPRLTEWPVLLIKLSLRPYILMNGLCLRFRYLERLIAVRVSLLLHICRLLIGCCELVPLHHQGFFELFLGLGLQKLLPEGDVREHGGESSAKLHCGLGAFLLTSLEGERERKILTLLTRQRSL